jgi:hypothetical protein
MDNKYESSFTMGANIVTWTKNFVIFFNYIFLMVTYVNSSQNVLSSMLFVTNNYDI